MKRIKWLPLVVITFALLAPISEANASTNCRAVARDTQEQLYKISQTNPNDLSSIQSILSKQGITYPECSSTLREVVTWNSLGTNSGPWPFPQSGDPKTYPLGPISWWWDVIWISLFGRNYLLMFLFGWEIFLAPFGIILPLALGLLFGGTTGIFKLLEKVFFWRKNPPTQEN